MESFFDQRVWFALSLFASIEFSAGVISDHRKIASDGSAGSAMLISDFFRRFRNLDPAKVSLAFRVHEFGTNGTKSSGRRTLNCCCQKSRVEASRNAD
jgi:hypothetical protein